MNQSRKLWLVAVFLMLCLVGGEPTFAAVPGEFGVKVILPENQVQKDIGYFDLLVTPTMTQTLEIVLINHADKSRKFAVRVNPAMTSAGGTIDYSQSNKTLDETVPFDISEVVTLEKEIYEVPAASELVIPLQVKMPNKTFSGRVLGGIHVVPESTEQQASEGVSLNNKIAYNLAIVLQENTNPVAKNLKLLSGNAEEVNGRAKLQFLMQNPTGTIINELVFSSKIYYEEQLFIEYTSSKYLVAPYTNFPFNIDLGEESVQAGKYRAEIQAASEESQWNFSYDFEVAKQQANAVNKNLVYPIFDNTGNTQLILLILAIIGAVLIIIVLFKRKYPQTKGHIK